MGSAGKTGLFVYVLSSDDVLIRSNMQNLW